MWFIYLYKCFFYTIKIVVYPICVLTGERLPIIKKAVRVESNRKANLFSILLLSGDDSRISGISLGNNTGADGLETTSALMISNFGIFFEPDQDTWVEHVLGFFFWAIFNRQNKETAFFTDSKSISNTVANWKNIFN